MKKNNPCDDIQGQQSFDGLELTVRVDNSRTTVKVNNSHIDIPKVDLFNNKNFLKNLNNCCKGKKGF